MIVTDLIYSPISGGPFAGSLAVHLGLGHTGTNMEPPFLIEKILNWPQGASKTLEIHGDLSSVPDAEMLSFCKAIKDWNYHLIVTTNGLMWPAWFTLADWLTVIISTEPWLMHECQEIRFLMVSKDSPEPRIPLTKAKNLYVVPGADFSIRHVYAFIKNSKNHWGILIGPSRLIMEDMLLEKETGGKNVD